MTRPAVEFLEDRVALSAGVALTSATTVDSRSVLVGYTIDNTFARGTFDLGIYRSADAAFDGSDVRVAGVTVGDPGQTAVGSRTITVAVPEGLTIDPAHPFVLAVADPTGGDVGAGDVASFRKYVIGGVAHGLDPSPVYVQPMAEALRAVGYDRAVPFFWIDESIAQQPGMAVAAGRRMADQIVAAADSLPEGSVIDLHLIGHSRGGVVISEAMRTIQERAGAAAEGDRLRGVLAGWSKMTFLDPHPAHNAHTTAPADARFFSASPGPLGRLVTQLTIRAQEKYQDPEAVVPAGVEDSEVFFQDAPYFAAPNPVERLFNIWGETPIRGASRSYDLTGIAPGHYEMPYWYLANVVPTLRTAGTFTPPAATVPLPTAPSASATDYERSVLVPALVRRPGTANQFLRQAGGAASALERGKTRLGLNRTRALLAFAQRQRRAFDPAAVALLGGLRPLLGNSL